MKEEDEFVRCRKCKEKLMAKEIDILSNFEVIGGYCTNEKCEMFELLVVV